ncbi:MAG: NADH-quinone oxidoreductase subunit NuoE [Usitatibacter sp.]
MKHLIAEFDQLRSRFPAGFDSSMVLPCLRRIQEDRGYVADEDIAALVEYLGVPRIQVEEVLSFYGQFRRAPVGRCHIEACRNISCSLLGAERLIEHLSARLGINPGQTTADGQFSLATVECMAACGTAPMVVVNGKYLESMDAAKVDALIDANRVRAAE